MNLNGLLNDDTMLDDANAGRTMTFSRIPWMFRRIRSILSSGVPLMDGTQGVIKLELSVDSLRFATFGSFTCLLILGVILTNIWGGIPDNSVLERILGNKNVCLYFDFRPIPYVIPPLYCITVVLSGGEINLRNYLLTFEGTYF